MEQLLLKEQEMAKRDEAVSELPSEVEDSHDAAAKFALSTHAPPKSKELDQQGMSDVINKEKQIQASAVALRRWCLYKIRSERDVSHTLRTQ